MLPVCAAVAGSAVVRQDRSPAVGGGIVPTGEVGAAGVTQIVHLTLLQERVVLILITAGSAQAATARAEILLFVEVLHRGGGEGGLGLGGETGV